MDRVHREAGETARQPDISLFACREQAALSFARIHFDPITISISVCKHIENVSPFFILSAHWRERSYARRHIYTRATVHSIKQSFSGIVDKDNQINWW